MSYAEHVMDCVEVMYDQYGPPLEKTAEAMYFYNATKDGRNLEALTPQFVKMAESAGADPWEHAARVAAHMDRFVKMAQWGGAVGDLSRFYVDWAIDLEKRAFMNVLRAGLGTAREAGRRAVGALTPASRKMTKALAGKAAPAARSGSLGQVFKKELKQARGLEQFGGGSYARGKKLMAQEAAGRQAARAAKATPPPLPAQAVKAAPAAAAPAAEQAAAAATKAAPAAEQAAAAATKAAPEAVEQAAKAAPGMSLSDKLIGGGLLAGGIGGGAYLGTQFAGQPGYGG